MPFPPSPGSERHRSSVADRRRSRQRVPTMSILSTRRSHRAAGHESSRLRASMFISHLRILAAAIAIALFAVPALAGESVTDESKILDNPSAHGYKPRLLGLSRYRQKGAPAPTGTTQVECPACDREAPFEPHSFRQSTIIDNNWMPLIPGRRNILRGVANRGGGLLDHLVIFTVTDLIKEIDGVPCV